MSTIVTSQSNGPSGNVTISPIDAPPASKRESIFSHLVTSIIFTVVSVVVLGILYPLLIAGIGSVLFPHQAGGSMIVQNGKPIGSEIIGQLFTKPQYFQGRPSAAGKNGYDPTSTGGTNLAPTSKKLIDATKATIAALKKANPSAPGEPPMDLITSSGSGIDPDVSPEGAYWQAPRVASARHLPLADVRALIGAHIVGRTLGILGEPRVNVLELNRALDAKSVP
ncbi:MAG: potassium-transporting ATPase subunit KdpC [Candidatus Velthaea sp.]